MPIQSLQVALNSSRAASTVIETLQASGFEAYLVGGCVRDQLLGSRPKDFDVATNATPEQIKPLFDRCILIGKRFRLAHVYFGREMIEVATFRGHQEDSEHQLHSEDTGMILRDNHFGTIEEDAIRRDFTVNALYYNPTTQTVLDYCGGLEDIQKRRLKLIGDPQVRFREDPVRMLRAVRFATKLNLQLEPEVQSGILELSHLLNPIAPGRLFDEYGKFFLHGLAQKNFEALKKYRLLEYLLPTAAHAKPHSMWLQALKNTDERLASGKGINPIFLISVLLWHPYQTLKSRWIEEGLDPPTAETDAANRVIENQVRRTAFPKHLGMMMREMWQLQRLLEMRKGRMIEPVLTHPRFRAAYDLLLLRGESGEVSSEICAFWTEIQTEPEAVRAGRIQALLRKEPKRHRRSKR